jgi:sulfur carrier protein
MTFTLNGQASEAPAGLTVSQLIERLQLTGKRLAVELNGDILPRSEHATTVLADGDRIEIVQAIGGG